MVFTIIFSIAIFAISLFAARPGFFYHEMYNFPFSSGMLSIRSRRYLGRLPEVRVYSSHLTSSIPQGQIKAMYDAAKSCFSLQGRDLIYKSGDEESRHANPFSLIFSSLHYDITAR